MSIQLNRIKRVSAQMDAVSAQLGKTARYLEAGMNRMIAGQNQTGAVDMALARANVQQLMVDSGYYEVTGNLLDTGYQKFIDQAHEAYKSAYGKNLQYSDVSLKRLDQIRQLDASNFNTIAEDNINQLQRVMTDYQFGAVTQSQAAERLSQILGPDFERYADTVIRATATAFDREANNLIAIDAGFEMYEYMGPDDSVTSDFCKEQLDAGEKPLEYWQNLMNPGGYPAMVYGGHPSCRHQVVPVIKE